MAALTWDSTGERFYETGVSKGVVYPFNTSVANAALGYDKGVAWNGLTGVTESPSGADATALYADDIKYLELRSAEEFGFTVTAYTYPDEFAVLDGTASVANGVYAGQQPRGKFGMCYRTVVGNDVAGDSAGYKLHLIYGATASPSEKAYSTINDSPSAVEFSWTCSSVPVTMNNHKPTSVITIDSTKANTSKLTTLENILYGNGTNNARLPAPDEVITLMT